LLLIEDSEDDALLLLRELTRGGYNISHQRVDTPAALTAALDTQEWDLVISDHAMPHFTGTDALTLLRAKGSETPFIFVSGTLGEETAVAALKVGAQDYVMKTNLKRLVPAVQRELREVSDRRERRKLENHVMELQKFEAIGRLAGGIAHDFNNVLGAIMGWAELAYDEAPPGSRMQDRLQKIRDQAAGAARLTAQLLAFARKQVLQRKRVNLNVLVEEGTALLRRVIGAQIDVRIVPAADLRVTIVDRAQIEQVLMNLCLNARDAMPRGGMLIIETQNVEIDEDFCRSHSYARPGSYVLLSVSDTGFGMDAATIQHIFEPFFTTKELGKGTGLGLATVYGVVKQHDGFVYVYSEPDKGTSFHIYLPADSGEADRIDAPLDEPIRKGTETILLCEDHDGLRQTAQEILQVHGYTVIAAANGLEAVQLFKANADRIDLVIVDIVMPGLAGPDAYARMSAIRPGLDVIFTTGYTSETARLVAMVDRGVALLQKPYSPKSLTRMIGTVRDPKH